MARPKKAVTRAKAEGDELVQVLSGKAPAEPKFKGLVYSNTDLIHALNYYSAYSKAEQQKEWAIEWAMTNAPELVSRMNGLPASCFLTFGALARMSTRGYDHDQKTINRIKNHFRVVEAPKAKVTDDEVKAPVGRPRKSKNTDSLAFQCLDESIDCVLKGIEPPVFSMDVKENHKPVIDYCKRELENLTQEPEQYKNPRRIKALRELFTSVLERLTKVKALKKATKVAKVKKVNPSKVVQGVKYQKSDKETGLVSLNPLDTLERSKMYVWDTKYRRLIVFVAKGTGFTYTGTTLHNVDLERSYSKTVRKPVEMFKGKKYSIRELNKVFGDIRAKETPMKTGRFNDSFVILKVTEKGA